MNVVGRMVQTNPSENGIYPVDYLMGKKFVYLGEGDLKDRVVCVAYRNPHSQHQKYLKEIGTDRVKNIALDEFIKCQIVSKETFPELYL